MAETEKLYSATNPDLRDFKAHGGKMISYQGWEDTSVVPMGTIDFYQEVTRVMGGAKNTLDFYRLFTSPGGRHCSNMGQGADAANYVAALEAWVEKGQAPRKADRRQVRLDGHETAIAAFPRSIPPGFSSPRPLYLYPQVAHYNGSGDPKDAKNYSPVVMSGAAGTN